MRDTEINNPSAPQEGLKSRMSGLKEPGSRKKIALILLVALVVLGAGFGGWFYMHKKAVKQAEVKKQEAEASVNLKNIFAIGKLPVDEDPLYSEVKNLETVKDSAFFKDAKIGDTLLYFKKARMAGILRPSEGRIISSALVVGEVPKEFRSADEGENAEEPTRVAIFNGTKNPELTEKAVAFLTKTYGKEVNVVYKDNARKTDYKKTLVVDLAGLGGVGNNGFAKSVAAAFKGEFGEFPVGEKLPPTMENFPQILIFVGSEIPQ